VGAGDGAVHGSGVFGAFGDVLGDVGGDFAAGELAGVAAHGPDVGLLPEAEDPTSHGLVVFQGDGDGLSRRPDGFDENFRGGLGRRGFSSAFGSVEADDGVVVDQAALLVLGDLGEGDPQHLVQRCNALQVECGGDLAAQVGGEAGPQRGGVGVPQHRALVVVGAGVDRGSQFGIIGAVVAPARAGESGSSGVLVAVVDGTSPDRDPTPGKPRGPLDQTPGRSKACPSCQPAYGPLNMPDPRPGRVPAQHSSADLVTACAGLFRGATIPECSRAAQERLR
jgi:hypothetical protein